MAGRLSENLRVATPLEPTALNNENTTGTYLPIKHVRRALFILNGGASVAAKTYKLEIFQAKTEEGGSAEAITGISATATSNIKAKKILATLTTATDTDVIVVNGTSYIRGTGWVNSAALIVLLNARGDCIATAADEVVTIIAKDGYALTVAAASGDEARVVITTLQTIVTVEVSEHAVNVAGGFNFVAPKVTMAGSGYAQVTAILEMDSRPDSMGNVGAKYPA